MIVHFFLPKLNFLISTNKLYPFAVKKYLIFIKQIFSLNSIVFNLWHNWLMGNFDTDKSF